MSLPDGPPSTLPPPVLSVVVPFLDEEAVLDLTYTTLKTHLAALGESYEMVFVDDGSTDRSRSILAAHALNDPTVRIVALSRNFGHEMATTAGLHHARGQAVIVMDADLQDPPELIPELLRRWREGYEVVYGVRETGERSRLEKADLLSLLSFNAPDRGCPHPAIRATFGSWIGAFSTSMQACKKTRASFAAW